jgi:hypothetical protein
MRREVVGKAKNQNAAFTVFGVEGNSGMGLGLHEGGRSRRVGEFRSTPSATVTGFSFPNATSTFFRHALHASKGFVV